MKVMLKSCLMISKFSKTEKLSCKVNLWTSKQLYPNLPINLHTSATRLKVLRVQLKLKKIQSVDLIINLSLSKIINFNGNFSSVISKTIQNLLRNSIILKIE